MISTNTPDENRVEPVDVGETVEILETNPRRPAFVTRTEIIIAPYVENKKKNKNSRRLSISLLPLPRVRYNYVFSDRFAFSLA